LFASAELQAEVGTNIHYARAPVTTAWPQVIFFAVAERDAYLLDYKKATVQVSVWAAEKYQALKIYGIIKEIFREYRGLVATGIGNIDVNWTQLVDASALPQADGQLFGHQLRFELRTRGGNLIGA